GAGAGSLAYATVVSTSSVIHACVSKEVGLVRVAAKCRTTERALTWSSGVQQAPAGPQGPAGAQGPQGGQGATGATGAKGDTGAAVARAGKPAPAPPSRARSPARRRRVPTRRTRSGSRRAT